MVSRKEYNKIVERNSPKSKTLQNCARAFVFGGAFCALGQGIMEIISLLGVKEQDARTLTSVALIFLGVLLTLLGVYDKIAKHAGALLALRTPSARRRLSSKPRASSREWAQKCSSSQAR